MGCNSQIRREERHRNNRGQRANAGIAGWFLDHTSILTDGARDNMLIYLHV
jgi:hypothetical protein